MSSPELAKLMPEKDAPGLNFTETELTLGLPGGSRGGSDPENGVNGNGKRGISQTVDLSLGSSEIETCGNGDAGLSAKSLQLQESGAGNAPPAKTQVVGWPPVRSAWKNALVKRCMYVKVAVDGAPYLRKVDLEMYGGYKELLGALEKMFTCCTISNHLLTDPVDGTEYVPTYEDKDGDWMLVGDVPWKMFVESCKRLRLMKSSEAVGLAPRTPKRGTNSS